MHVGWTSLVSFMIAAACGCGSSSTKPAALDLAGEVRKVDAKLNQMYFSKDHDEIKLRGVVHQMNSIDISRCPQDYQAAYIQLASALGEFIDYVIETNTWEYSIASGLESFLRGFSGDPFGAVREDRERRRQIYSKLREAVANYQRTLAKYKK